MKAATKQGLGYALIILGIIGMLLPLMPGIVFVAMGMGLLGAQHPLVQRLKKLINFNKDKRHKPPRHSRESGKPQLVSRDSN